MEPAELPENFQSTPNQLKSRATEQKLKSDKQKISA